MLTPTELKSMSGLLKKLAKGAYDYTQKKREALAMANLLNASGAFDLPPLPGV